MQPLLDQNYYEVLEVPLQSTQSQIERAYKIARATWQPASTATYSLFADDESESILRRIEEAYAVLCDPERRVEYDERLLHEAARRLPEPELEPEPETERVGSEWAGDREDDPEEFALLIGRSMPGRRSDEGERDLADGLDPEDGIYDGAVLRRIRMSRGIELAELSRKTKINSDHLRNIEEDHFEELPAPVYVRGFVKEFARQLGLEPKRVATSYYELMTATSAGRR